MTGDADRFELWILHDQAAQQREREPEVQLELALTLNSSVTPARESARITGRKEWAGDVATSRPASTPTRDRSSYA